MSKGKQEELNLEELELTNADAAWFHVFRSMIESGDVAKMGPHAFTVYTVIKSCANYNTGQAFPSFDTIAEKSGVSRTQLKRDLKTLEDMGYLTKSREGRKNLYTLREKIGITDDKGRPSGSASWDYLPKGVQDAVADLRNVLVTGDFEGAKIVNIQKLQININKIEAGGVALNIGNIDKYMAQIEDLPPLLREEAKKNLLKKLQNAVE